MLQATLQAMNSKAPYKGAFFMFEKLIVRLSESWRMTYRAPGERKETNRKQVIPEVRSSAFSFGRSFMAAKIVFVVVELRISLIECFHYKGKP